MLISTWFSWSEAYEGMGLSASCTTVSGAPWVCSTSALAVSVEKAFRRAGPVLSSRRVRPATACIVVEVPRRRVATLAKPAVRLGLPTMWQRCRHTGGLRVLVGPAEYLCRGLAQLLRTNRVIQTAFWLQRSVRRGPKNEWSFLLHFKAHDSALRNRALRA